MQIVPDYPCECGLSNAHGSETAASGQIDNRIINGIETQPNEYPWQVALVRQAGHTPFCGGSVISNRHILTAAHCTQDIDYVSQVEVLVGEHDLMTVNDECQRYRLSRILEHPKYNDQTVAFDFSILVLSEALHFSR